nr:retrovirus-related Pol polyprotein from transposon TNT 1-94 [Tanacetum cinerariifolium]
MTNNINHFKQICDDAWTKHSKDLFRAPTALDIEILIQTCLMPLTIKTHGDSLKFVHELKQEMHANIKYVESLKKEIDELESEKAEFSYMYDVILHDCVSKDVMCSYLQSLSDLDALAELQCMYLHKVKECDCLAQRLSKQTESVSKKVHTELLQCFAKLEKQSISLEIALQKDLKAQMQDKNIAISELKKLIEKGKRKSVDTKFDRPSVVRQPNAQRIPKPSVLGRRTPFSNSLDRIYFQKTRSVSKVNVSEGLSKPVTTQTLPQTAKRVLKSNQSRDKVLPNNSQVKVKKTQVEVHPRIPSVSNKMKSVTACKDSLNSRTLNANAVCATCNKCLIDSYHFTCVTKMLNDVHARTKKPSVVPISTRKPKSQANKSMATPNKKKVTSKSTNQKPHCYFRVLYENTNKAWKWWIERQSPSGYKWVPKTKKQWVPKAKMQWVPKAKNDQVHKRIVQLILFIVDYGCTKHMTGNLKLLCNFVDKFLGTVRFGNDQFTPILGYGDLVQGNVTINRVYYVEGLNHNLFSVGQFCDANLEVAFRKSTCFVSDIQGNDLLIGNRGSDLYTISLQESTSSTPLCLMAKATPTQAWLWHRRLSHLNFDYINLLLKKDIVIDLSNLKYVKDQLYSSCELSKAKRSSFKSKAIPSSKGRLNLLHMDLCGPMRVASINGKKYILVIVDDYSRYTWTLFLLITVRTDRGTEFLNKTLNAFFKEEGIEHQTSTARTPEQNGIVERWNCTLVEAAQTIFSPSQLPLFFWAEAIATACYTQNRSIIIPTHDKTPYHIINDRIPSIKHLHIFCCICYITRDGENLDKMKQKGYQCILASDYDNPDLVPQRQDVSSSADADVPSQQELNPLFGPLYDEFFNTCSNPSTNVQSTSPPSTHTNVHAEENNNDQAEEGEQIQDDEFTNPFYHPLEQVRGNPSRPVQTRRQLATDLEMCMYALTVSTAEPKNIKEAMANSAWIEAMQEELHQFNRLQVWELVDKPFGKSIIRLKWLWKNKKDED